MVMAHHKSDPQVATMAGMGGSDAQIRGDAVVDVVWYGGCLCFGGFCPRLFVDVCCHCTQWYVVVVVVMGVFLVVETGKITQLKSIESTRHDHGGWGDDGSG